jgi:PIN domain nuclease of toxin-antitoxin system
MRLLLDTHIYLWWDDGGAKLAENIDAALRDPDNTIYVSAASIWEIAIKRSLKKLTFSKGIAASIAANQFNSLPITAEHAEEAASLPRHHRDPFDHILIAQARIEQMTLVTIDAKIGKYAVSIF